MASKVIMPALGMAQETGKVLAWLKKEGEAVKKGEPLMEIHTDKTTVEIEAHATGILACVTVAAGEEAPVGEVIALVLAPGEAPPFPTAGSPPSPDVERVPATPISNITQNEARSANRTLVTPIAARLAAQQGLDVSQIQPRGERIDKADVLAYLDRQSASPTAEQGRVLASPKARRLARERDIELSFLTGSGPDGAVLAADVPDAMRVRTPFITKPRPETSPVSHIWQVMAERTTQSWTSVPHFYLTREVNVTRLIRWREGVAHRSSVKITYTDLLVKVVTVALSQHPHLNASWQEDTIRFNAEVNVGLAVAVEKGLVVPVVHRADTLTLNEIAARRNEIVARAQAGKLRLDDVHGGTFTISNLGMYGVDGFNAIINAPQAAILAVGRIAERVVAVNGVPVVQPLMILTLSCDHRVVDGARGAQFLQTLVELIEEPLTLLM